MLLVTIVGPVGADIGVVTDLVQLDALLVKRRDNADCPAHPGWSAILWFVDKEGELDFPDGSGSKVCVARLRFEEDVAQRQFVHVTPVVPGILVPVHYVG